jgi:hypothetical protein
VVILDERIVKTRRILPMKAMWKSLPVFFMSVLPMKATRKAVMTRKSKAMATNSNRSVLSRPRLILLVF